MDQVHEVADLRVFLHGSKAGITGGAGFIGSNLAEALTRENEIIIIDNLSSGKQQNIEGIDVRLVKGSILDLKFLKSAFQDADCVFHKVAIASVQRSIHDPIWIGRVGTEGTLNVLVTARDSGVRKMVFASSAAVYGDSSELPKRKEMCPDPKSPYAVSKMIGEHHCKVFHDLYGSKTVFSGTSTFSDPGSTRRLSILA
jgi:UDP-glucose 4-epimerase